jgi:hypothetical protein
MGWDEEKIGVPRTGKHHRETKNRGRSLPSSMALFGMLPSVFQILRMEFRALDFLCGEDNSILEAIPEVPRQTSGDVEGDAPTQLPIYRRPYFGVISMKPEIESVLIRKLYKMCIGRKFLIF